MGLGARQGIDRTRTRLERWLGRRALAAAERLQGLPYAPLNYDSERSPAPRWGHGRPSHPGLRELLARHDDACRAALERVVAHREALARIPPERGAPGEPFWLNPWQPPLDAAALYAFVRDRAPPATSRWAPGCRRCSPIAPGATAGWRRA